MRRKTDITISDFYCTKCGQKGISIPRKNNKRREAGHLKSLYCTHCKTVHNAVEIRPYGQYNIEDFYIEFENHNFDENGKRIVPFKQFLAEYAQRKENNNNEIQT